MLYGPDTDSGTFEYFTEVICGRRGNSRTDYTPSSNDNILIQGVEGDVGAIGLFWLRLLLHEPRPAAGTLASFPIVDGAAGKQSTAAGVIPSDQSILNGQYKPLSRPLFLYVNRRALKRPEVAAFLNFYIEKAPSLVSEAALHPASAGAGRRVSRAPQTRLGIEVTD